MAGRCLLVVHAHPDDEVFSTGGILARYAEEGDRVVVVYCTNGDAGEMYDPDYDAERDLPRLGEIRQAEARRACSLLGVTDVFFLGYRDSGMKDTDENHNPTNFANAPLAEAAERLERIMSETAPQVVVTYDTDGGYGHPDHVKTHEVTDAAFEHYLANGGEDAMLYYSARSREGFREYVETLRRYDVEVPWVKGDFNFDAYGVPESEITANVDISKYVPLKKAALSVHKTQIKPDFFYLRIPDEALAAAAGREYFVRISPPPEPGRTVTDLFST